MCTAWAGLVGQGWAGLDRAGKCCPNLLGIGPQPRAQFVNVPSLSMVCRKYFFDLNVYNPPLKGRGTLMCTAWVGLAWPGPGRAGKCCPNSLRIGPQPRAHTEGKHC